MNRWRKWCWGAWLLAGLATAAMAAPGESFQVATRGFGNLQVQWRPAGGKGEGTWTSFAAEDAAHARLTGSKRLADLLGFGDLKLVSNSGLPGTVLELPGAGCWLLGLDQATFHELFAPDRKALSSLAQEAKAKGWQPVPAGAYPRWLDCFDNAGPGVWVGGGGDQYVLPADFEWLQQRGLSMCTLSPTESRLVGPGMVDTSIFDWHTAMAAKYGLAYRTLFFPAEHEWLWNREPLPYVRPEPGRTTSAPWLRHQANSGATAMEPVPAVDPYSLDMRRRLGTLLRDDPNYLAMHGCTEIPEAGVDILGAVLDTPGIKALWHGYLSTTLGMDLATVGQLHQGDHRRYQSWDQVEVPRPTDFVGWDPAACLDLRGTWQMHEDTTCQGREQGWQDPAKAPADWVLGNCNDPMILLYTPTRRRDKETQPDFWMRRSFEVPAARRAGLAYLHIARDVYHGNHSPAYDVWVNGKLLAKLDPPGAAFEQCHVLADSLRDGPNEIVMNTHGAPVPGYIFLGATPLRGYPNMTPAENRRWFDAVNFDAWLRVGKIEAQLRATRAVDPDRPLKMMALINLLDLSTPLCERYGAYQHDTGGAGGYWCPMTGARLARSHGLAWSCEQGGPPKDATAMQAAMTFYLMYGNDAMDLVFAAAHYRDNPGVSAWFDQNLELIRCIGKMHLPTPPIAVLRSSRATRLGFGEPWNWDIARGTLQGVGRNFAYLEVPDLLDDRVIDQFRVVIDDGTVLLSDDEIEGIKRYVRRGGIFVAQHHTGRHSPAQGDSWPLARSWGLTITPKYMTAENYHKWPLAKMRFAADQDLLPSLRGKEIEGSGVAVDYLGQEHTGAVSIAAQTPNVRPAATWDDGTMAIADIREGRGRFILLGTPFYTRMRDVKGMWVNDAQRSAWLDEFLTGLGVERDSWTSGGVWAEIWRSKNGVYDLYPVARMSRQGDAAVTAQASFRRAAPLAEAVEVTALGHPRVKAQSKDGKFSLPAAEYGLMQARMYAAPRNDLGRSAWDWFHNQAEIWRALPPVPETRRPVEIAVPADLLPLAEDWTLKIAGQSDRTVRLGAFGTLGLPEETVATFAKTVAIPAAWKGQRVELVFDAEGWFWGILPQGRLLLNGQEAALKQPIMPAAAPGFTLDVSELAAAGPLNLRLEIDGTAKGTTRKQGNGQSKPNGVTGLFYLQAIAPAKQSQPLGNWQVASAFNRLQPAQPGAKVKGLYLETRFKLPQAWPAPRLFLESPGGLGFLTLNGQVLLAPAWMRRLDVSGLVYRDGRENLLRWTPASRDVASWDRPWQGVIPELKLVWTE